MNRTAAALAVATMSFASRTLAEPCPPRAELAGDPAVVARVREELGRLGVAIGAASPGCPAVRVQVQLDERGAVAVAVAALDDRRSEGRVVTDASLAAAWVDSWLRDDLDGRWRGPVADASAAASALAPRAAERPPATHARRSVLERGALAVSYERAYSGDPSSWSGGSAAGCAALGPVCAGTRMRYQHQVGGQAGWPSDERTELAALLIASTGFELGRMAIVPELGLGVGRLAARRSAYCTEGPDPSCNVSDPKCGAICVDPAFQKGLVNTSRSVSSYAPRAAAALRIAVPLFDHVWLDAIASVTYIPFTHAARFMLDPGTGTKVGDPAFYVLPGEPTTATQLGVGLRVGVP